MSPMNSPYLKRSMEPVVEKAATEFPAVVLTGPRQSGKTTLLQHVFGERCHSPICDCQTTRAEARRGGVDGRRQYDD